MYISKIKVSEEFLNTNGRHLWLGCDVVVNEGEDEKLAFKKGMNSLIEANKEFSKVPVIQGSKSMVSNITVIPDENEEQEWQKVKEKLSHFKYSEDAYSYLVMTPYQFMIEAKTIVNNKPSKNEKQ